MKENFEIENLPEGRINNYMKERERGDVEFAFSQSESAIKKIREVYPINTIEDVWRYSYEENLKKELDEDEHDYLGRGFVPMGEKERIHRQYLQTFEGLKSAVATLDSCRRYAVKCTFDAELGALILDKVALEKQLTKKYFTPFSEQEKQYYLLLAKLFASMKSISKWEESNGFQPFTFQGTSDPFTARTLTILDLFSKGEHFTAEDYTSVLGRWFGKKRIEPLDTPLPEDEK